MLFRVPGISLNGNFMFLLTSFTPPPRSVDFVISVINEYLVKILCLDVWLSVDFFDLLSSKKNYTHLFGCSSTVCLHQVIRSNDDASSNIAHRLTAINAFNI